MNAFDNGGYPDGMARNAELTNVKHRPSPSMQRYYDYREEDDAEEEAAKREQVASAREDDCGEGVGMSEPAYTIAHTRLKSGAVSVQSKCPRVSVLAGYLGRYSRRWGGWVMSPKRAAKLERLYVDGGELENFGTVCPLADCHSPPSAA